MKLISQPIDFYVQNLYNGHEVAIDEQGNDVVSLDGKVHDPNRIDFLNRYLNELERACNDGVDVCGYFLPIWE